MLTHDFQRLLICFFAIVFLALVAYGWYCRQKANSYIGTGRVAEIESYYYKATAVWIVTFCLSVGVVMHLV